MSIKLSHLYKSFDDLSIYENLCYDFPDKGLFLVCGDNGSGKTTLLNIISGKDSNYEGKVLFNNIELNKKNRNSYSENNVFYLTQDSLIFTDLSTMDNLLIPFEKKDLKKANSILSELNLIKNKDQKANDLSSGEKQRLSFSRLLYSPKNIILIDEITSNLDETSCELILKEIVSLSKEYLVIFVTHDKRVMKTKEANILEIIDRKISTKKIVNQNVNSPEVKKKTVITSPFYLSFKREIKSHVIVSFITLIFSFFATLFGSFSYSFETKESSGIVLNKYNEKIKEIYSLTSPLLPSQSLEYEGLGFHLLKDGIFRTSTDYSNYEKGMFFSGFFEYEETDMYPISLIEGRLPLNEGEAIISDICARNIDSFELGLHSFTPYLSLDIVGVYKSIELDDLDIRYSSTDVSSISNFIRISYSFMQETVFLNTSSFSTNTYYYHNSMNNIKKFINEEHIIFNDEDAYVISLNRDGKNIISSYKPYLTYSFISYALIIGLFIFLSSFVFSFFYRNKRKYLLLRFLGESRTKQTRSNLISFSISSLSSYTLALILSTSTLVIMNSAYSSSLGISIKLFDFYINNALLILAIIILFLSSLGIMLYCVLSKKDLSSSLAEVKQK